MHGTGNPALRRAAIGAICLAALVAIVAVSARGPREDVAPTPAPATSDAAAVAHAPRPRAAEPPSKDPPPRSIRVAVTSLDGAPIPGARVELVRGPESDELPVATALGFVPAVTAPAPDRTARADDGVATMDEVPSGAWIVAADAPGFARHAVVGATRLDDDGVDVRVSLAAGTPFGGCVFGPTGAPVAGVAVILAPTATSNPWPSDAACLRTTARADGTYRFESVEAGEYCVWVAPQADLVVSAEVLRIPAIASLDIHLSAGTVLEGALRDADDGGPVVGARVVAKGRVAEWGDARWVDLAAGVTDAKGRFRMQTWRRRCNVNHLVVDDARFASIPLDTSGMGDAIDVAEGQRFEVSARVGRAGSLTGVLRGPDGPLGGRRVVLQMELTLLQTLTDCDGRFRFARTPVGPGLLSTAATIEDATFVPGMNEDVPPTRVPAGRVAIVAGRETTRDLVVEVKHIHVTGRAVDEAGAPIAEAVVTSAEGSLSASSHSAADGTFALDVRTLDWRSTLTLRRRGFLPAERELSESIADLGDVTLRRATPRSGTVVGADGAAVPWARVRLSTTQPEGVLHWRGTTECVAGPDGTFRLGSMFDWDGSESVCALEPADGATSVFLVDGTARLPTAQRVSGTVVAADTGAPIAGALVRAVSSVTYEDMAQPPLVARTGADGRFQVDFRSQGPGPQTFDTLRLEGLGRIRRTLRPEELGTDIRVELVPALDVTGAVRQPDGAPVAGVSVDAEFVGEMPDCEFVLGPQTADADGRALFLDVPVAAYRIRAGGPGWLSTPELTIPPGRRDFGLVAVRAARVEVIVVDEGGAAVAGADVEPCWSGPGEPGAWATGADGRATIDVPSVGEFRVGVSREGYVHAEVVGARGGEPLRIVLTPAKPR